MIRLLERGSWTLDDWKLVVCNADDAEVVPPALCGRRGGRPSRALVDLTEQL